TFDSVSASHIRVTLLLSRNLNVQLKELELYMQDGDQGIPSDVTELAFVKPDGTPYINNEELTLDIGGTSAVEARGKRVSGEWISLPQGQVQYHAVGTSAAVTAEGSVTGIKVGATRLYAETSINGQTIRTPDFWIVVKDDQEFQDAKYIAFSSFAHKALIQKIGEAAILEEGKELPVVTITPNTDGTVSARWFK
ncbi:hypothetical protein GNF82_15820, partial [Clostridium perfringens]